ncbi:MAG: class I SAM-dependent methyltransferase family protein [Candidatus Bathyarchaeota archaeon]|nr:class I SAM-dependent methyltransferase family protein [Candidatus Bathyarchaeota archaeon]
MTKTSVCLKVPKQQGEKTIALAAKLGLINKVLGITRDDKFLFVPLVRQPDNAELTALQNGVSLLEVTRSDFEEKKQPSETLTQALQTKLPPELLAMVPQAFDIVGDIVIIEIPPQLKPHQTLIGETILQTHKNIKTVLGKAGDISGVYRIRDYTFIAGIQKTSTIHREFGCAYHVDVAKAYFSPRLSHEHMRVASQVQSGEVVADLFAGVGPFSVLIGKQCPEAKVYAVDLNPDAVELLKLNVRVNRVDNRVFAVCADAREIAKGKLKGAADRVIMNLPETAIEFVDAACNAIKPEGGIVHFYGFVRAPDAVENLKQRFTEQFKGCSRKVQKFLYAKAIRETAPFESQIVLDAEIK